MLKDTFGTAARSFHPELGGNKAGPLISAHHSSLVRVV